MSNNERAENLAALHYKDIFYTEIGRYDLTDKVLVSALEQMIVLTNHSPRPNFDLERNFTVFSEMISIAREFISSDEVSESDRNQNKLTNKFILSTFGLVLATRSAIREENSIVDAQFSKITKEKSKVSSKIQKQIKSRKTPNADDKAEFSKYIEEEKSLRENIQPQEVYTIIDGNLVKGFERQLPKGVTIFWTEPEYTKVETPELENVLGYSRTRNSILQITLNQNGVNNVFRIHSYDSVLEQNNKINGEDTYRFVFQRFTGEQEELMYGETGKSSIGVFKGEYTEAQLELLQKSHSSNELSRLGRLPENKGVFPKYVNWSGQYNIFREALKLESPILDIEIRNSKEKGFWTIENYPSLGKEQMQQAVDYVDSLVEKYINDPK